MPAKKRPRSWSPLDLDYFGRRRVQELAETHGQAGPLVWLAVILEAKKHAFLEKHPGRQGELFMRYTTLAEMTFCDSAEQAEAIVRTCIELRLLEPLELQDKRFHVRLTKWSKWESDDVNAAERKRQSRARQRPENCGDQLDGDYDEFRY
jgi:hypothetical protein